MYENGDIEIEKQKNLIVSTKRPSKFKIQNGKGLYDYFVKGNILYESKETKKNHVYSDSDDDSDDDDQKDYSSNLTDEQLFQICGGLTAHKGARHGLTMSAKLARLEQQEKSSQIKTPHQSPKVLTNLPPKLIFLEKQEKSLQFELPSSSPKVLLKPILKESTPDNSNFKKRKSVQFNEDLKLKIFSYCVQNCDKDADISIKMEDDETPSSTLAVYIEEFSMENNINAINGGIKKKKKKLRKTVLQNEQDIWELIGSSLQPKTNDLYSLEQKENNENFEQTKKKKKKKLNNNVSNASTPEQIFYVDPKILQSSESEVITETLNGKTKKRKKRKLEEVCFESDADACILSDSSSSQLILPSELRRKKRKERKIKLACSKENLLEQMQEDLDVSLSNHIEILNSSASPNKYVEKRKKKQSVFENTTEQVNLEEDCIIKKKKKKSKKKLEDTDIALEVINVKSFSPKKKKKKHLKDGS